MIGAKLTVKLPSRRHEHHRRNRPVANHLQFADDAGRQCTIRGARIASIDLRVQHAVAAIANVRNVTIAKITIRTAIQFGQPSATMNAAATANGKAKIECSNLMVSRNI